MHCTVVLRGLLTVNQVLFNPPPTAYQEEKRTGLLNKRKSEELEQEADLISKKRRLEDPLPVLLSVG